jgi:AcrR family transcriptional regulator
MGARERRARELQDRRRIILEESKKLFFERGYENVSVQDICDAVEYGRSVVYGLFDSKEEIYSSIYVEAMAILADMLQEINPDAVDFDAELMKLTDVFFEFYRAHRPYYKALFYFNTNTVAYSKIPPHIMALKEAEVARAAAPVMALLQSGIRKGILRPFDIPDVVYLYWATTVGIITSYIHKEQETDEETIRAQLHRHSEIYLSGLKAR